MVSSNNNNFNHEICVCVRSNLNDLFSSIETITTNKAIIIYRKFLFSI